MEKKRNRLQAEKEVSSPILSAQYTVFSLQKYLYQLKQKKRRPQRGKFGLTEGF
jgi:hypothetical protein